MEIKMINYRKEVMRTANASKDQLALGAMGLAGETGEVIDLVKKHLHHDKPLDKDKLILELGDVAWYFELLCECVGVTREEVERRNVEKLRKRYPEGFTVEAANARKDENAIS